MKNSERVYKTYYQGNGCSRGSPDVSTRSLRYRKWILQAFAWPTRGTYPRLLPPFATLYHPSPTQPRSIWSLKFYTDTSGSWHTIFVFFSAQLNREIWIVNRQPCKCAKYHAQISFGFLNRLGLFIFPRIHFHASLNFIRKYISIYLSLFFFYKLSSYFARFYIWI